MVVMACLCASSHALSAPADPSVDFNRDIRPILAHNCFSCHGPDGQVGPQSPGCVSTLRKSRPNQQSPASSPESAPRPVATSELMRRITTPDEDDRMPPVKSGKTLVKQEVELLRRWIAQGAVWKKHWAYDGPVDAPLPEVHHTGWCKNQIDYYVLARLEQEGLSPSPEAFP